ncbi:hypothetical protein T4B_11661 [Trichinella pseudospiralis]|uniref:Uncharacterized protein n=1 Tax=Trichinella pseudospiralis TaxID=6337 RepID=A0A0V1GL80_TRIPS|nr:hypothetical protein T4B_11661 [Trichinella pseudospiralis]
MFRVWIRNQTGLSVILLICCIKFTKFTSSPDD